MSETSQEKQEEQEQQQQQGHQEESVAVKKQVLGKRCVFVWLLNGARLFDALSLSFWSLVSSLIKESHSYQGNRCGQVVQCQKWLRIYKQVEEIKIFQIEQLQSYSI